MVKSMDMALDSSILINGTKSLTFLHCNRRLTTTIPIPNRSFPQNHRYPFRLSSSTPEFKSFWTPMCKARDFGLKRAILKRPVVSNTESSSSDNGGWVLEGLLKRGVVLAAMVFGVLVYGGKRALASEGVANAGYGVIGQSILLLRNAWPKALQVLQVFKEQGIVLAVLLGLSAFFSMAETAITTLWPWKGYRVELGLGLFCIYTSTSSPSSDSKSNQPQDARGLGKATDDELKPKDFPKARWYVLNNCVEVTPYLI